HVERVGVLHDEFTRPHDAETRTDFIAELGLDLVIIYRQLPITVDVLLDEAGYDFLVRRAEAVFALGAVDDMQHQVTHQLPAAGLLPQFGRLYRRHQHFEGAGGVHFLADNRLDAAQYFKPQRRPGIQAGSELADHAGTQHQLVADNFGVGRNFTGRGQGEGG